MTKKIKVVQGGQGAAKNVSIAQIILEKASKEKLTITVMSDTYKNLKDGAIADFQYQVESSGMDWENMYNKSDTDLKYHGSIIQFRYISDTKSDAGKSKRRDILYLNEGNKFGWGVASTYIGRTKGDVYIDYNPDFEFWAHTEVPKLKDKYDKSISEQIIVTYIDNEMCPQAEIDYILSRKDNIDWFRVYGLGQTGYYSDRQIYSYQFIDKIPDDAKRIDSGMDFGVSPDPTILIDVWKKANNLYVDEVFCLNNLMPEKIEGAQRMAIVDQLDLVKHPRGRRIIADSAGATEIKDIRKHKYSIRGVHKPKGTKDRPGSIDGINKLRGYTVWITRRSTNMKKGAENFHFKVDHNDKIIPELDEHEPDGWAALRYVMKEQRGDSFKVKIR